MGVWNVLRRRCAVSGILFHVPHFILPFANGWPFVSQVSPSSCILAVGSRKSTGLVCGVSFRLDYCGIALLILGSFVPWLHFGFYCQTVARTIYLTVISILAAAAVVVSLWDKFSQPAFRPIRAGT